MELLKPQDNLAFHWKDVVFKLRAKATTGDKYALSERFADARDKDGVVQPSKAQAFPFLIERFVVSWSGVTDAHGHPVPWSMEAFYQLPADPSQDIITLLGAYIFNHTGLAEAAEDAPKKKD